MKIKLNDLKQITEVLFNHLKEVGYDEIEIKEDYYWNIPTEKKYDAYDEPKDLTLGQLTDDYENLLKIKNNDNVINYGLVWLSSILRVIGEKKSE